MTTQNLLVELLVEELPPKALQKLGEAFAAGLKEKLILMGLISVQSQAVPFASPRRLAAHISQVLDKAPDQNIQHKLMPAAVGLDATDQPTPALLKKIASLGVHADGSAASITGLQRIDDPSGKSGAGYLVMNQVQPGCSLAQGLQSVLSDVLSKLPIPKVMSYQLGSQCAHPGWTSVQFVRPVHGVVALHGSEVIPVNVLGLQSGRCTKGHRFEALHNPLEIAHADQYAAQLLDQGAVIASFEERRAEIARQLQHVAGQASSQQGQTLVPIDDDALLDEVTALVERPKVMLCSFDQEFLDVPQECLILSMKVNQKYFPMLDAQGKLTHHFLVVSNVNPSDTSRVVKGNERVIRPRLADAQFFFTQDCKIPLIQRVKGLSQVVYHHKLGSQADRSKRVQTVARDIAQALLQAGAVSDTEGKFVSQVEAASQLAKADLLTDMVGEFPELQGIMGGYYARHDGEPDNVAWAIEDHYKPRYSGDVLPRGDVGLVVALADKLETLVGMFGTGHVPTGDKDPYALRRQALGVIRMLTEKKLPLALDQLLTLSTQAFGPLLHENHEALAAFFMDRLAGHLREQLFEPREIEAVLSLNPQRLDLILPKLLSVREFLQLPQSQALAAANKRVGNILKKIGPVAPEVRAELLREPAEIALYKALQQVMSIAYEFWQTGESTAYLMSLADLRDPVDQFFEHVMVNDEDAALRQNRLGLLMQLHQAMNRVADLSKLATG
jgi:glycyl-tRNA synthetase beta chain